MAYELIATNIDIETCEIKCEAAGGTLPQDFGMLKIEDIYISGPILIKYDVWSHSHISTNRNREHSRSSLLRQQVQHWVYLMLLLLKVSQFHQLTSWRRLCHVVVSVSIGSAWSIFTSHRHLTGMIFTFQMICMWSLIKLLTKTKPRWWKINWASWNVVKSMPGIENLTAKYKTLKIYEISLQYSSLWPSRVLCFILFSF